MKKIFIVLLMIFSLFLFSCKKNDDFNDEVPISERRSYDGTLRDDTFYFVALTEEESSKDKEYSVSDFDLKNLYSVEYFLKPDNPDDLLNVSYYAELKLLFKNLTYEIARENEKIMNKDERIHHFFVNKDFDLSNPSFNIVGAYLETNLDIDKIYYLSDKCKNNVSSTIVNDIETFNSIKNNYKYDKLLGIGYSYYTKNEFCDRYDEKYFINNSLLYLKIETEYIDSGYLIKSIYLENGKIYIKCNCYTYWNRKQGANTYYYLFEINEKLQINDIVINYENLYYYI